MTPPSVSINPSQQRELGRHDYCLLSIEEYHESDGTMSVCLECDTCGKVLARFTIGTPSSD